MENKHTPGPWIVNLESSDCAEDKLSVEAADDFFIAQVDFCRAQEANARLIAAAPEMLEALEDSVKILQQIHDQGYDVSVELLQANKAIRKARGE